MKTLIKIILSLGLTLTFVGCTPDSNDDVYVGHGNIITELDTASYSSVSDLHYDGYDVICSMSVGTYQYWTDDSIYFTSQDVGFVVDYKTDEDFLDITSNNVWNIMQDRITRAYDIGCDSVLLENTDSYEYDNGFLNDYIDEIDYLSFLINEANSYGMDAGALDIDVTNSNTIYNMFDFIID